MAGFCEALLLVLPLLLGRIRPMLGVPSAPLCPRLPSHRRTWLRDDIRPAPFGLIFLPFSSFLLQQVLNNQTFVVSFFFQSLFFPLSYRAVLCQAKLIPKKTQNEIR
ncbi:uncharacterized protein P884DRAFT_41451 [Thermothelomyces heterothallicus CBS 202.75]|uniref:uncharacterized protein n=1 Tax=Thermothelomyces heterothallicus CBS 202.75 TaxID=1149848 RepID=UPI00374415F1